jgi:hypothetical protein
LRLFSIAGNVPAHTRSVVKLRLVSTNRHAVYGRNGLKYRERRGPPDALISAVNRDCVVFAYAWIDQNGRWRLEGSAPLQPW